VKQNAEITEDGYKTPAYFTTLIHQSARSFWIVYIGDHLQFSVSMSLQRYLSLSLEVVEKRPKPNSFGVVAKQSDGGAIEGYIS